MCTNGNLNDEREMNTWARYNLGRITREAWLCTFTRARIYDDQGGSLPCLLERLRPEFALQTPITTRFIQLARHQQAQNRPGLRPILCVEHLTNTIGRPEVFLAAADPDARSLVEILDQHAGKLPLEMALWLTDAAAASLESLHDDQLFHGALTPADFALSTTGQLWLDNTAATCAVREHLEEDAGLQDWMASIGEEWLAPESQRGQPQAKADLYFLGALLFRLLTGLRHPQEWEPRWSMLMAQLHQAGLDGRELDPVLRFLHRTLTERPEHRFETIAQLREHLEGLGLQGEGTRLRAEAAQTLSAATAALVRPSDTATAPTQDGEVARDPADHTRLLPQQIPILPAALREKIGPHPLEILARSRYTILRELGVGGMGTVYEAQDRELDQKVAIKVLHRDMLLRPGTLERFRRELRLTRDLNHPHIVPAYHLEAFEGLYLYSMKYIEGPTLRSHIRRHGALPAPEAIRVMRCIADALDRTHSVGVVHRDIKSANIMLETRTDGPSNPYLMDFGIASDRSLPGLTRTGQQLGTPQYMAPEQALGKEVSFAADIYSFAVVFYEALTAGTPFQGDTSVAIYAIQVQEKYTKPRDCVADLPEAVADMLERCLRADPEQRPASMQEILHILDTYPENL